MSKVLVSYSGGKDSQASLLFSVEKFGSNNIEAVFCDTGWEHPLTYSHIRSTCESLQVKLTIVRSSKYSGFLDLARQKKRFPSVRARFCTSELKSIPFIDYVLSVNDNVLIVQGIRSSESARRSHMNKQCRFFKYYFEPYNSKGRTHSYRKADVQYFCSKYSDDVLRPVFDFSSQEVIDYIISHGQKPNPLYSQGFRRVGCFPCVFSGHKEIFEIIRRYPSVYSNIIDYESEIGSSFFKLDSIPTWARTGISSKTSARFTTALDLKRYLMNKNKTLDLFADPSEPSCSSYYHLCE